MDHPKESLEMMKLFLEGKDIISGKAKIGVSLDAPDNCVTTKVQSPSIFPEKSKDLTISVDNNKKILSSQVRYSPVVSKEALPLDGSVLLFLSTSLNLKYENDTKSDVNIDTNQGKGISFHINVHHDGITSNTNKKNRVEIIPVINVPSTGIKIDGLINGVRYLFVIRTQNEDGVLSDEEVVISATPGCYSLGISQCCGHGICSLGGGAISLPGPSLLQPEPRCYCDDGYSGKYCGESVNNRTAMNVCIKSFTADDSQTKKISTEQSSSNLPTTSAHLCLNHKSTEICEIIIEMSLGHNLLSSWTSSSLFGSYKKSLLAILKFDLERSLAASVTVASMEEIESNDENFKFYVGDDVLNKVAVTGALEVSWTSGSKSPQQATLYAKVTLLGSKIAVLRILHYIQIQVKEPSSVLRNGLLTSAVREELRVDQVGPVAVGKGPGGASSESIVMLVKGGSKDASLRFLIILISVVLIITLVMSLSYCIRNNSKNRQRSVHISRSHYSP